MRCSGSQQLPQQAKRQVCSAKCWHDVVPAEVATSPVVDLTIFSVLSGPRDFPEFQKICTSRDVRVRECHGEICVAALCRQGQFPLAGLQAICPVRPKTTDRGRSCVGVAPSGRLLEGGAAGAMTRARSKGR